MGGQQFGEGTVHINLSQYNKVVSLDAERGLVTVESGIQWPELIDWLLSELRAIPHVEILRLGTRLPVTLPFRVTASLTRMLQRHHPIWVNTHFNHPKELTDDAAEACARLVDAGIPRRDRDLVGLLTAGDEVAWLVGHRLDDRFKVTDATTRVLVVRQERE